MSPAKHPVPAPEPDPYERATGTPQPPQPDFVPATYDFPPGTPPEVPADFAEARDKQLADQLTPEEVAEFRALRAEKKARDAAALKEAEEAAARLSPPTHTVLLADGSKVDGSQIATHYAIGDELVPVAAAYLKPEFVTLP
jgi:hypothetical protein